MAKKMSYKSVFVSIIAVMVALLTLVVLTTPAQAAEVEDGPVYGEDGAIAGYSYGGIYWDADEYEAVQAATATASLVDEANETEEGDTELAPPIYVKTIEDVKNILAVCTTDDDGNDVIVGYMLDGNVLTPDEYWELKVTVEGLTRSLGMPISVMEDEDGATITYLGGYIFTEAKGTSLSSLMSILQKWDSARSPYVEYFFTTAYTYATEKVETNNEPSVSVDKDNNIVTFSVVENIDEIEMSDVLFAMRSAVLDAEKDTASELVS